MHTILAAVAATIVLAAAPTNAQASSTLVGRSGAPDAHFSTVLRTAAAPSPPITIQIERVPCPESSGSSCTGIGQPIYLHPRDDRMTFLHEVGHHFDYAMSDTARTAFLALIGQPHRAWRSGSNSPHEQFAEAWSLCAGQLRGIQYWDGRLHSGYSYEPTRATHRRACQIIRDEASRQGW